MARAEHISPEILDRLSRSYTLEGFLIDQEAFQILSFSVPDAADKW
jgi:hypothetical protein